MGPGKKGQRFTPRNGPNALYVSEDLITAQAEYFRVARAVLTTDPSFQLKADPAVQLTIQVNVEQVLDLTDLTIQQAMGTTTAELTGPWSKQMIKGLVCPTQILATAVYASARFQAMRYTSARSLEHANLIIWEERLQLPSFVEVQDKSGTLSARIPPEIIILDDE